MSLRSKQSAITKFPLFAYAAAVIPESRSEDESEAPAAGELAETQSLLQEA